MVQPFDLLDGRRTGIAARADIVERSHRQRRNIFLAHAQLVQTLRSRLLSDEERRAAVKDFALTKGLLVALLAGAMSACFSLGLESGAAIQASAVSWFSKSFCAPPPITCSRSMAKGATPRKLSSTSP